MDQLSSLNHLLEVAIGVSEFESRLELSITAGEAQKIAFEGLNSWLNEGIVTLSIDGDNCYEWGELNGALEDLPCLIVLQKAPFIEQKWSGEPETEQFVFFTTDGFLDWLAQHSSPFSANHPLYRQKKTLIRLYDLDTAHEGEFLSVVPLNYTEQLNSAPSNDLPCDEDIRSLVHFVSKESLNVDPSRFRLPDSAMDIECLRPLFLSYEKLLASCLVEDFYSIDRVVVAGIKRLTLRLCAEEAADLDKLTILEEAVRWVYAERSETRLLLLMDRISLDLPTEQALIPSIYSHLDQALEQASYRYEFVIKDRKEAHSKELSDLQKDIKTATDGYSKSANDLVTGLLRDALSSIFLLSVGLFSKFVGNAELLDERFTGWLFKGLCAYLVVSIVVRTSIGWKGLTLSLQDLKYWKNVTRNHMSRDEFDNHIHERTQPYKKLYIVSASVVALIYAALVVFVLYMPTLFSTASKNEGLGSSREKRIEVQAPFSESSELSDPSPSIKVKTKLSTPAEVPSSDADSIGREEKGG